jgi:hypothetical protein
VFAQQDFQHLPENEFNNDMKRLINTELGQLNQLGDGAPIVWLWDNSCWLDAKVVSVDFKAPATVFVDGSDADVLMIPKEKTNLGAMRKEFFQVIEKFK